MKTKLHYIISVCCILLLWSIQAYSTPILAVDFNAGGGSPSPTQLGWSAFARVSVSNQTGPITASYTGLDTTLCSGTVTVSVASGTLATGTAALTSRDASTTVATSFPAYNLYRDFVTSVSSIPLTISISGLTPGKEYSLAYTVYTNASSRTMTVADYTSGTAGNSASVSGTDGTVFNADTSEDICTRSISATANASGFVTLRVTANTGAAMISGLSISKAWHPTVGLSSILPIDFNSGGGSPSPTNAGYLAFARVASSNQAGPISATYTGLDEALTSGSVTVTIASGTTLTGTGAFTSRDRTGMNDSTFPLYYMYRDWVVTGSGPMSIGVSGLQPNLSYLVAYTAYNDTASGTMTIANYTTGTASASASVSWTGSTVFGPDTDPNIYTKAISATSDAQGKLLLRITPSAGGAIISGLKLTRTPASWYLVSDQVAGQDWSSGYSNQWNSASDGSGASPASINIVDNHIVDQHQLRTPASSSTFSTGRLVFSGAARLTLLTDASSTSTITNFASTGGTIAQGVASVMQSLNIKDYENATGSMILSSTAGGGIYLNIGSLYGSGDFKLMGSGTCQLDIGDASDYTGTIRLMGGTLAVQTPLATKGALMISSSTKVTLNKPIYCTSLNIAGTQLVAGIYTYSTLQSSYPAIFTGGSSSGLIAVYSVDTAGPVRMGGVNLSIAEWGTVPGTYGVSYSYPTEAEFDYYHGKGLNLIRLPFRWERIQPALNSALNGAELARVDTVVGYARARGMKIILDIHNYDTFFGNMVGSTAVPNSAFRDLWRRLADHFKTETAIYGYGLMNEPHDTGGTWMAAAQEATWGIREVDITHYVIVAGDSWSGAASWENANAQLFILDPVGRLMYEAHCYFVSDLSLTYDTANAYPNLGVDRARPFVNWLKAYGLKGYIGEFGVPYNDSRWFTCLDLFLSYVSGNGISTTYWAGGPGWSEADLLNCEPHNGVDRPQISILENYP